MTHWVLKLRVTAIVARRNGGCIFNAAMLEKIEQLDTQRVAFVNVKVSAKHLGIIVPVIGMWVSVSGEGTTERREIGGVERNIIKITATEFSVVRPTGDSLVQYLSDSAQFVGIGAGRARQLWSVFGEELYRFLDDADVGVLSTVLPKGVATTVVSGWKFIVECDAINWLQSQGFSYSLARRVVDRFGNNTKAMIEADPYRLLSFSASWSETDNFARNSFQVSIDDPRRILGACEEALYRAFALGHTVIPFRNLRRYLQSIIPGEGALKLAMDAIRKRQLNGGFIFNGDLLQSTGAAVLERSVADGLLRRLSRCVLPVVQHCQLLKGIDDFERIEGIALSGKQRAALAMVATEPILFITGAEAVGKATVIKAVLQICEVAEVPVRLTALAGGATRRICSVTGRPAQTIGSFLKDKSLSNSIGGVLIIYEASCVDLLTMHRIILHLHESWRIVLIGDSAQQFPVGPGLILHALSSSALVPSFELPISGGYETKISELANKIRRGHFPELPESISAPVALYSANTGAELSRVVGELYAAKDSIVLCFRISGEGGALSLNLHLQQRVNPEGESLVIGMFGVEGTVDTGFRLNDPVLYTKNNDKLNLQEGSLGKIVKIVQGVDQFHDEHGELLGNVIAWVEWDDGCLGPILADMLNDLRLGYAISTRHTQGRRWKRAIIPLTEARNLDRRGLYTAVTRAEDQVIFVGSMDVACRALATSHPSTMRETALDCHVALMAARAVLGDA